MLLKLKQIDGGVALKNDVDSLKQMLMSKEIIEEVASPSNSIQLKNIPIEGKGIFVEVNGINYSEKIHFSVNYATGVITWEHRKFDIDDQDEVFVKYFIVEE